MRTYTLQLLSYDINKKKELDAISSKIITYCNNELIPLIKDIIGKENITDGDSDQLFLQLPPFVIFDEIDVRGKLDTRVLQLLNIMKNRITKEQKQELKERYQEVEKLLEQRKDIDFRIKTIRKYQNRPELHHAVLQLKKNKEPSFITVTKELLNKLISKYKKHDFIFGIGNRPSSKQNIIQVEKYLNENNIDVNHTMIYDMNFKKELSKKLGLSQKEITNILMYLLDRNIDISLYKKLLADPRYWGRNKKERLYFSVTL